MTSTVQLPPQRTTKRLLVAPRTRRDAPEAPFPVPVGPVCDLSALLGPRRDLQDDPQRDHGRLAALSAELRGLTVGEPVLVTAPLILAAELTEILDTLDGPSDLVGAGGVPAAPDGVLLRDPHRVRLACRSGNVLGTCGALTVSVAAGRLRAHGRDGASRPVPPLEELRPLLGPVTAVVAAPEVQVWRWQLTRLIAALTAWGASELRACESSPLT